MTEQFMSLETDTGIQICLTGPDGMFVLFISFGQCHVSSGEVKKGDVIFIL